jgi:hypothetical protein
MCGVYLFAWTFLIMVKIQSKYNMIIFKSKIFLKLHKELHVDCDFIIQILLNFYIILGVEGFLKQI